MVKEFERMRVIDTRDTFAVFGTDSRDGKRLDAIRNEYGQALKEITNLTEAARANPLEPYNQRIWLDTVQYTESLVTEFDGIVDRLQCVMERTCSLKK